MPLNISKIGKVLKTINRVNFVEFNASLPVKVEVKKEINPITYLIKLGNREVETKSYIPLKVGEKYLAQIKEVKNKLEIKNLKEFPKILDLLKDIDLKKELTHYKKEDILNNMQNAKTKEEFLFFANLLLAYEKKIYHLSINENGKKALMQYRVNKNRVSFYAIFTNLGEIEGEITPKSVKFISAYSNVLSLINMYKDELGLEVITVLKDTYPIFKFTTSLIDLKA